MLSFPQKKLVCVHEEHDPGHSLAVKHPEDAIRVGYWSDLPSAEWFGVGVSRTVRANLRWGRVVRDDRQDVVDSGRGDVVIGDVESPPRDVHEVTSTVDKLALMVKPSSYEIWLWFMEVVLVAVEVVVELGAAVVGDCEGHRPMSCAGPHHHGLDVFGWGVCG